MEHATKDNVRPDCRILIVEDQILSARSLQILLAHVGFRETTVANTGEEALSIFEHEPVDLILMDIGLSDGHLDGIETVEKIKAKRDVPVVYITARADNEALKRARKTQPYGYIVKPYHEGEILAAIEIALQLHSLQTEVKLSFEWLLTTLNSIADAVIATDTSGLTRFMNPEAESLTGWSLMESSGKPVAEILHIVNTMTSDPLDDPVVQVLTDGKRIDLVDGVTLNSKTGMDVPIHCTISPIFNGRKELFGTVVVFRNVFELKREREQLLNLVLSAESQKRSLERYFPENLVDLLVDEGQLAELGGKNILITVMICDIRNSTGLAESMSPGDFATMLSDLFSGLMDLTYANGGSVNKLIGDGMLITFGCPIPGENDAISCVKLALQFKEYVRAFNEIRMNYHHSPLAMGMGISTGTVFAGNIGSTRHMEYTVLGNAVNTASRLEKLTKILDYEIAMDRNTYELLNNELEIIPLGYHRLPGKSELTEVFFPVGMS